MFHTKLLKKLEQEIRRGNFNNNNKSNSNRNKDTKAS